VSLLAARESNNTRSRLEERRLRAIGMRYMLQLPKDNAIERVLVAVHGVSREWRELPERFAKLCAAANIALVVPRFSQSGYRGYQRLEVSRQGLTADVALLCVLDDVAQQLGKQRIEEVRLFGYSGGAQFAHRFSLLHPHLVKRQALAAAGFYTMPDANATYPYGLASADRGRALEAKGLTIPTKIFVGELDVERDAQLRTGRALDRRQGHHRVERAQRFVVAVRTLMASRGLVPDCSLEILHGCGHSFVDCAERGDLAKKVVDFLVPEAVDLRTPPTPQARPRPLGPWPKPEKS